MTDHQKIKPNIPPSNNFEFMFPGKGKVKFYRKGKHKADIYISEDSGIITIAVKAIDKNIIISEVE